MGREDGETFACLLIFDMGTGFVAQADLELVILLPQPPVCWDCRHVPPCPADLIPNEAMAQTTSMTHSSHMTNKYRVLWEYRNSSCPLELSKSSK